SDLALAAALEALGAAQCAPREFDCVILATATPDHSLPGSAGVLGAKLGIPGVPAVEIHNQCGGFLYGLSIADHFIRLGTYRTVLVAAAETMPKRTVAPLAEGAGAVIVVPENDERCGILSTGLHADGRFARALAAPLPDEHATDPARQREIGAGLRLAMTA